MLIREAYKQNLRREEVEAHLNLEPGDKGITFFVPFIGLRTYSQDSQPLPNCASSTRPPSLHQVHHKTSLASTPRLAVMALLNDSLASHPDP